MRIFERLAEELGIDLRALHYVFDVRMLASLRTVIKNFFHDYGASYQFLIEQTGATEKGFARQMQQCKVLAHIVILSDILRAR